MRQVQVVYRGVDGGAAEWRPQRGAAGSSEPLERDVPPVGDSVLHSNGLEIFSAAGSHSHYCVLRARWAIDSACDNYILIVNGASHLLMQPCAQHNRVIMRFC
jgi:hypothetical protein